MPSDLKKNQNDFGTTIPVEGNEFEKEYLPNNDCISHCVFDWRYLITGT